MDAIREMYARWAAGDMGEDDQWGDVTAEPRGVDYAEVTAGGVPAMWLAPHGADPDRVIVAWHGGGFVGGSLYTHRKMYGHLAKAAGVRVLLATYRHVPEFRYPAQIEDAVAAYRWVAARARTVALAGDRHDHPLRGPGAGTDLHPTGLTAAAPAETLPDRRARGQRHTWDATGRPASRRVRSACRSTSPSGRGASCRAAGRRPGRRGCPDP
jgi:hypothetical protein